MIGIEQQLSKQTESRIKQRKRNFKSVCLDSEIKLMLQKVQNGKSLTFRDLNIKKSCNHFQEVCLLFIRFDYFSNQLILVM